MCERHTVVNARKGPSDRVRQIAQTTLQLSNEDIDDLFSDELRVHSQVSSKLF